MDLLGSVVAALPCPPLSLQCVRRNPVTETTGIGYANTHHILFQAVTFAMQRDNEKDNIQRAQTQTVLTNDFQKALQETPTPCEEKIYESCTRFTRAYLHAFMPDRKFEADARFAPYDVIKDDTYTNNPIVRAACEHLAGMIFYDNSGKPDYAETLEPLKKLRFKELLKRYAKIHTSRAVGESGVHEITPTNIPHAPTVGERGVHEIFK